MEDKSTVGFPFSGRFASDSTLKATKNVSLHFFFHNSNSCELNQQIP
jgi:hypothetical protein